MSEERLEKVKKFLRDNIGAGDAYMLDQRLGEIDLESEDGVFTDESYEEWLEVMAEFFADIIEVQE